VRDMAAAAGGFGNIVGTLNGLITQQAAMLSFLDDFKLMMIITLASLPIVFLLRRPKALAKPDPAHAIAE